MKNLSLTFRPLRRSFGVAIVSGALVLGACGGDDDATSTNADDTTSSTSGTSDGTEAGASSDGEVQIERSRFDPLEVTIAAGGSVEFVNNDPFDHTVTSAKDSSPSYDSGPFGQDETFTQTYDEAGSYAYFCQIHPTMRATVIVE